MGPRIKFAVYASFTVNFFLFVIQLYAAISTGSLAVSGSQRGSSFARIRRLTYGTVVRHCR